MPRRVGPMKVLRYSLGRILEPNDADNARSFDGLKRCRSVCAHTAFWRAAGVDEIGTTR